MSSKNHKFIEKFQSKPVRMLHYNILVEGDSLDDLVYWEQLLDQREMDYAITEVVPVRGQPPVYKLYCDVNAWDKYYRKEAEDTTPWSEWRKNRKLVNYDSTDGEE
jgi:hypothetical protein